VLTLEEIANLAREAGKPAETLMNVVELIARRFKTDVCSAYLLEPDRANWYWLRRWDCAAPALARFD
jgi:starch phosphorylase